MRRFATIFVLVSNILPEPHMNRKNGFANIFVADIHKIFENIILKKFKLLSVIFSFSKVK